MESHSGSRSPLDLYETKHSDILAPDSDRSSETSNSTDTESECLANGSDENGESSFSSKSSSASSLQSLAKFIQSNLKPVGGEYNAYATSYITTAVPSHAFFPDDTDSYTAEAPPFLEAVKIKDFARREARRDELGHSSRREKIIPQSKSILKQIQASENNNAEGQTEFLFFKARQWCEVNKALFVDAKYPKVGPEVIRRKYSEEHKSASKDVKKLGGLSDARRVFKINDPMEAISSTDEEREQIGQQVPLDTGEDQRGDRLQDRLQEELANIFGDVKPISDFKMSEDDLPWQFKARKTGVIKSKQVKKPPFTRTEYPPVSRAEKISELRRLLPGPKSPELETDYLSGIWEPELDIDEFNITPADYDSRLVDQDEVGGAVKIDWFKMNAAKEKCKKWLLQNTADF